MQKVTKYAENIYKVKIYINIEFKSRQIVLLGSSVVIDVRNNPQLKEQLHDINRTSTCITFLYVFLRFGFTHSWKGSLDKEVNHKIPDSMTNSVNISLKTDKT